MMRIKRSIIALIILTCALTACHHDPRSIFTSFYYWRHDFKLTESELKLLDSLHVNSLYVKYFDVDRENANSAALPKAEISFSDSSYHRFQIVPVVYITNVTLERTMTDDILALSDSICQKIFRMDAANGIKPSEVQIDCDWTLGTKEKYFALLKRTKVRLSLALSCTIRLHQVKYKAKTGVPPVDRGMLMYYNMGRADAATETNSIYDPANADKYVGYVKDYPLPMDVALPIFSWGVRYTDGKARELLNGFTERDFEGNSFFHREKGNWYVVDTPGYLHGFYLKEHDRIRIESVDPALCKKAAAQLAGKLRTANFTLTFFDLQPKNINRYGYSDFEEIREILR